MAVVAMGEKEGTLLSKESTLIENLLKLKHIKAKDIMTPRSVVFSLSAKTTIAEAIKEDRLYIHSRIPIFGESIDHITGVVFNQNILEESIDDNDEKRLDEIVFPVHKVSENVPVSVLIDVFIKKKTLFMIIMDKHLGW